MTIRVSVFSSEHKLDTSNLLQKFITDRKLSTSQIISVSFTLGEQDCWFAFLVYDDLKGEMK